MADRASIELSLLLATADHGIPFLDEAIDRALQEPAVAAVSQTRGDAGGDLNALEAQRWGIVHAGGSALLASLAPLLALRREQQGADVRVYEVPAGLDGAAAAAWVNDVYEDPDVDEAERPRYLLLVGGLTGVSLDLQEELQQRALVGRLCFEAPDGRPVAEAYRAYADKVCAAERQVGMSAPAVVARLLDDGSGAIRKADAGLVMPLTTAAEKWQRRGLVGHVDAARDPGPEPEGLVGAVRSAASSLLITVGHGAGPPRGGWRSAADQRARQGALVLPRPGPGLPCKLLEARSVAIGPFLPGGVWFCFACFGAATPARSDYHPWLSHLVREGVLAGDVDIVLRALARPPDPPFVAALPQAALANPEGPLAVVGHVDMSFSYSFEGQGSRAARHTARFATALEQVVRGRRAGVALAELMRGFRDANNELAKLQQRSLGGPAPGEAADRAHLFMLRNDLKNFILLGDPAVRLSVT